MLNRAWRWLNEEVEGDTRLGLFVSAMAMIGCPAFLLWVCS